MRKLAFGAIVAVLAVGVLGGQAAAGGPAKSSKGVGVSNYQFTPSKITISAGSKVKWTVSEGDHTVTFKDGRLDQELTPSGTSSVSRKFKKPGTYKYFCRFHKNSKHMVGKVVVH